MKVIKKCNLKFMLMVSLMSTGLMITSCTKDQLVVDEDVVIEEYQLLNMMIVNEEDGKPQLKKNLNTLENSLTLRQDGFFTSGELLTGQWSKTDQNLNYYDRNEQINASFNIVDGGDLEIIQQFTSHDGLASGTIFYEYIKESEIRN